jgi:two-component system response regulator YesN
MISNKALSAIKKDYCDRDFTVCKLSTELFVSPNYLCNRFKKETGETIIGYLTKIRMQKAMELICKTENKIYEIAEMVGYSNAYYFSLVFKKYYNISPTGKRKGKLFDDNIGEYVEI